MKNSDKLSPGEQAALARMAPISAPSRSSTQNPGRKGDKDRVTIQDAHDLHTSKEACEPSAQVQAAAEKAKKNAGATDGKNRPNKAQKADAPAPVGENAVVGLTPVAGGISGEPTPKANVVALPLAAIKADPDIQSRAGLKKKTVDAYAERMKAGDKFPPLDVFDVDGVLLLADGFHRQSAAQLAGRESVEVVVHGGSRRDAIKFGIEANLCNGLAFTNKDKHHYVRLMLREFSALSDGAVAAICKVSQPFVSKVRRQLKTVLGSQKRIGRDGKKRKLPRQCASAKKERPKIETANLKGNSPASAAKQNVDEEDHQKTRRPAASKPASDAVHAERAAAVRAWDYIEGELRKLPEGGEELFWNEFMARARRVRPCVIAWLHPLGLNNAGRIIKN
jgi:hypothetical protein